MKQYIIWDNNAYTKSLVRDLLKRMDGTITIIDETMTSGYKVRGKVAYAAADYVDAIKDLGFPVIQIRHMMYYS